MKKLFLGIILLVGILLPVKAANYEVKELIPVGIKTTVVTKNFSYQNFYYDKAKKEIIFGNIRNQTEKELPITISVALFDKNKKNIGVFNYCSKKNKSETVSDVVIDSKKKKPYRINITKEYIDSDNELSNIKYIAILDDNINCHKEINFDYVGKNVDEIGVVKSTKIGNDTAILIKVLVGLGILFVLLFLYRFMFTNSFNNMDGNDVRDGYNKYTEDLKEKREKELLENPPQEEEKKEEKPIEILEQEEEAKNEEKDGTDLHNLYK